MGEDRCVSATGKQPASLVNPRVGGSGSTNCRADTNDGTFQNRNNVVMKGASLIAQLVKNLLQYRRPGLDSLDWECPLEKEMATHSSILAWRIRQTEEPGGLQVHGFQESDTT